MSKKKPFDPFENLVLDEYEQEIEDALNSGKLKPVPLSKKMIEKYSQIAKESLAKKKNINIRINLRTYLGLKKKAAKLGLPYQTLAGSILHQYASL
ncbi:MAG: hypothetical protein UY17_C0005G0011 [Candidatus Beckwithbacteria bacterium GW2011_GWC2_47_9]|uniref:Antitoxin n=3 Tax=Candidatus Beckwithiibacteriota TaxID=1752726 RepID=A0A0G1U1I1_9BACT|nr:MAG: hypothetical protein UY17_C0005G0011 [Candidatus Beckwithbacteria bacterium GW2011_GWC2_47_9]OGD55713.1 MAG: hypothetical protein A3E73_00930 [Candidatus Beckwithbacteria bacterium RIFCSPHIGHO2_12_FULL_47_17]OGD59953.1 MAG: hypothetical protein A3I57_03965 [Candidatus Beckwithbacteria bacterium RIFCSPLOWO2_02_FULL_47_23]